MRHRTCLGIYRERKLTAEELLKKIEQDFRDSGGHCGESTSERIARNRHEDDLATTLRIMRRYMK